MAMCTCEMLCPLIPSAHYTGMSFATMRCGWPSMRQSRITAGRSSQSGRKPRSYALFVLEIMSWDGGRVKLVWLAIGAW